MKVVETAQPDRILLPAGVTRRVRVNRQALAGNASKPFIVTSASGDESHYDLVEIQGPSRMVIADRDPEDGCYANRTAFVETESAILAK